MDRIVEFDTQSNLSTSGENKEKPVVVYIFKVNSKIITHNHICPGSNKCTITIEQKNLNQIRWGMKVVGPDLEDPKGAWADGDVTAEDVDYNSGIVTLNKPIYSGIDGAGDGQDITFYGDRNLSFGDKDNIKNITGIHIIDGMRIWTDNSSDPKKVKIKRAKVGAEPTLYTKICRGAQVSDVFNRHTLLPVDTV